MRELEYRLEAASRGRWRWGAFGLRDGLSWQLQIAFFIAVAALIISRRPDAIFHAQFWAEDGATWYSNAYNFGPFRSMLLEYAGYYQTLPRVGAAIALLFPFLYAPFVMNLIGLVFQVLPATFLVSSRCASWASLPVRLCFALAYVALPNSREIDVSLTNAQWHVALLACMVVLAAAPRNNGWRVFDVCMLVFNGLTGPFCIILLPVAIFFGWLRRERWRIVPIAVLGVSALIQIGALVAFGATRSHVQLGATPGLFLKLLGGQVYLGALVGENYYSLHARALPLEAFAILGTALIVYTVLKAKLELKLLLIFCMALFAAELRSPLVSFTDPQWEVFRLMPGARYWFFPMLAFVWSLIWCAAYDTTRLIPGISMAGLLTMSLGVYSDWRYPPFENEHFRVYANELAAAPDGRLVTVPLYPGGWMLRIAKKGPDCNSMPIGNIDAPPDNAKVSGQVPVVGWAAAAKTVEQVGVYLDAVLVQTVRQDIQRKDVDGFILVSNQRLKGWQTTVDFSNVAPGKHKIRARAFVQGGCVADFASTTVQKTP